VTKENEEEDQSKARMNGKCRQLQAWNFIMPHLRLLSN
jgi:hypothetical protein